MPTFQDAIEPLIPLLRCPMCPSEDRLAVGAGAVEAVKNVALHDQHLACGACGARYPITADFIPILWDDDIRHIFADIHDAGTEALANIGANMAIYDAISDDYHLHTRKNPAISGRLRSAAQRIFPDLAPVADADTQARRARFHLDYGCGPGHVLGWLKPLGFTQIGLDISLSNLRNARKHTGCLVVCGNACNMPFRTDTIDLVTESSVLHHILDWKGAVTESLRICRKSGGIVIDSEPSKVQMAWSPLAVKVFNARFPVYHALSYVLPGKYVYRDLHQARLNLQAEIHHQPGTGFPLDEIETLFREAGFAIDIVLAPSPQLTSRPKPSLPSIVLNLLSARNPWDARYSGGFTAVGYPHSSRATGAPQKAAAAG